jgi:hypothetical protein
MANRLAAARSVAGRRSFELRGDMKMQRLIVVIVGMVIVTASTVALAGGADGVWKTEADDKGAYLEVTIGPLRVGLQ